ncbi:MAG: CoB--CoM heterodisulfide reductase iron-sulfur subunit A family protein [Chloroflexota bacterium]|nr:CoB--CoM heterodisulfide reductase iron-sulfur subunit A family protein [Chloroflexota bacterium]
MEREPRIGVYVCHCGVNIAATVDVEDVTEAAAELPGVVIARDYTYMCSDPGQELIKGDIREHGLNRVVVASCSPRMHEPTFRAAAQQGGVNPYQVEMANIREQCSWVHKNKEKGTEKARLLVASAVAKAARLDALESREVDVIPEVLVIGGGVAGMTAALDVADAGIPAFLVEKDDHLGGRVADLNRTFPALDSASDLLEPLIERVQTHPHVTVLLNSEVSEVDGYVGNFQVRVSSLGDWETGEPKDESAGPPAPESIDVGSIVVATGYDVFNPDRKPEFGYSDYPNVITSLEMEDRLAEGDLTVDGRTPERVAFIQCVGSRDIQLGNPYCSRVCCMYTAKQSRLVREMLPDAEVTVFYIDVRTFGKGAEEFYDEARSKGVRYRRGNVSEIYRKRSAPDRVVLVAEDTLLGQPIEFEADLVVLAVGMEPREDTSRISQLLKLPRSADGFFLEAHPKLRPVDTAMDGIFLAGCCQAPRDIPDTVAQAKAAASSALIPLIRGFVPVESATAVVDEELCAGCGMCVDVCPYDAPALDELWAVSRINPVLCKACGACAVTCPSKAIRLQHFTAEQVLAQVDALVE